MRHIREEDSLKTRRTPGPALEAGHDPEGKDKDLSAALGIPCQPGRDRKSSLFHLLYEFLSHGGIDSASKEFSVTHSEDYTGIGVNSQDDDKNENGNLHTINITCLPGKS